MYLDVITSFMRISIMFVFRAELKSMASIRGILESLNTRRERKFWMSALREGEPFQGQRSQGSTQHLQVSPTPAAVKLALAPLLRSALFRQMGARQVRKEWPLRFFLFQGFKEPVIWWLRGENNYLALWAGTVSNDASWSVRLQNRLHFCFFWSNQFLCFLV